MSSELKAGGPIDLRDDLFAWGVVLYEMLTGKRPSGYFKLPTEARVPNATPALDDLVKSALCEVGDRLQDATKALDALDAVASPIEFGRSFHDCWEHPQHIARIMPRVSPSEILVGGVRVSVPDVSAFPRIGCIWSAVFDRGTQLAVASIPGLIVARRVDILRQWIQDPRTPA